MLIKQSWLETLPKYLRAPGKNIRYSVLQIVKTPNEWQAVLSLNSVLEMNGLLIYTTSALIGQSWDGGNFWTFFGNEGDKSMALMIKPDLSEAIQIPAKKEYSKPVKQ